MMAAGLGWSADDIFLWNCRGELIHHAPDGCTTLAAAVGSTRFIAHNEDGDPYLRERCSLVQVQPVGKPGFGSSAMRTVPNVGRCPLAALAAVGIALSLIPGMMAVKIFGSNPVVSSR